MGKRPWRCVVFFLLPLLLFIAPLHSSAQTLPSVLYVQLDGPISPASVDLLRGAENTAKMHGESLILLRLNTPGGLDESMREMVGIILNSSVPLCVWVGPAGARAASAGVFLVAAAPLAAMHPQTTIGAASPIGISGQDIGPVMADKIKNDLRSFARSLALTHGRNAEWYDQAVDKAAAIPATEAVQQHVVDFLATDPLDFLRQAGERGIRQGGNILQLPTETFRIEEYEPGFRYELLSWLLHPQIAYFLLLAGIAGLFFELATPGAILPGVIGATSLLLSLYALSILPTNVAGVLLILLAAILFITELFVPTHAVLSIAGLVSLFIGSTILFHPETGPEPVFGTLPLHAMLLTVAVVGVLVFLGAYLAARAKMRAPRSGLESLIGLQGKVLDWSDTRGHILVRGEIWFAVTANKQALPPETVVRIIRTDGLVLTVEPLPHAAGDNQDIGNAHKENP